jgi:hypothetical protein
VSQTTQPPPASPILYSKAFENLVREQDDLEGLLAYALYKQTLHERRQNGMPISSSADRSLASSEISTFRSMARTSLKAFESIVIAREKDDIVKAGALSVTESIKRTINERTAVLPSIFIGIVVGIVAWVLSLGITIVVAAMAPGKAQAVAKILGLGQ